MLAKIWLRLFWNLDSKSFIIFKILHQKKTLKKLHLEKWFLKSIKHLVTLLYYIIQRHVKNDMILRRWYWTEKKWFLYLASRAKKWFQSVVTTLADLLILQVPLESPWLWWVPSTDQQWKSGDLDRSSQYHRSTTSRPSSWPGLPLHCQNNLSWPLQSGKLSTPFYIRWILK